MKRKRYSGVNALAIRSHESFGLSSVGLQPAHSPSSSFSSPPPSSFPFPPANALSFGTFPFEWYNCHTRETPLTFRFVRESVLHPSAAPYMRSMQRRDQEWTRTRQTHTQDGRQLSCADSTPYTAPSAAAVAAACPSDSGPARWGCDCPNGVCEPATCACAQHAQHQYTRQSRLLHNIQPQSLCECWEWCSCHPASAAAAAVTTTAPAAAAPSANTPLVDGSDELPHVASTPSPLLPSPPPAAAISAATTSLSAGLSCFNRVVQRGPLGHNLRLVVFRTRSKGWGLKTLTRIPKNAYVCEYVGEVIHEHIGEQRGTLYAQRRRSNYLFSPSIVTSHAYGSNQPSGTYSDLLAAPTQPHSYNVDTEPFTIDSQRVGHVARFINHACRPNLISATVLIASRADWRLPRVAFFAREAIDAGRELTFYYGYKDHDVMRQEFTCRCDTCKRDERDQKRQRNEPTHATGPSIAPAERNPAAERASSPSPPASDEDSDDHDEYDTADYQDATLDSLSPVPLPPQLLIDSAPATDSDSLDVSASLCPEEYLHALSALVGDRKCIPIETTCCLAHLHPSRISLACAILQQRWPHAEADWHQSQIDQHRRALEREYDAQLDDDDLLYPCRLCGTAFSTRALLCAHRHAHLPTFACTRCSESFESEQQRRLHLAEAHRHAHMQEADQPPRATSGHHHQSKQREICVQPKQHSEPKEVKPPATIDRPAPAAGSRPGVVSLPIDSTPVAKAAANIGRSHTAPPPVPVFRPAAPPAVAHPLSSQPARQPPPPTPLPPPSSSSSPFHALPPLLFRGIPVRLLDFAEPPSSAPIRLVFGSDLAKLLSLPYQLHHNFMNNLASDTVFARPVPLHVKGKTIVSPANGSHRRYLCLTYAGARRHLDVHQDEVQKRSGLKHWLDTEFWPAWKNDANDHEQTTSTVAAASDNFAHAQSSPSHVVSDASRSVIRALLAAATSPSRAIMNRTSTTSTTQTMPWPTRHHASPSTCAHRRHRRHQTTKEPRRDARRAASIARLVDDHHGHQITLR